MVLYGIAGTLFAYCGSLLVASPLAAFAAVAGYQIVMFLVRSYFVPPLSRIHIMFSCTSLATFLYSRMRRHPMRID
jgi:hypothetical protein